MANEGAAHAVALSENNHPFDRQRRMYHPPPSDLCASVKRYMYHPPPVDPRASGKRLPSQEGNVRASEPEAKRQKPTVDDESSAAAASELDEEKKTRLGEALVHRFDSPENYVAYDCMRDRTDSERPGHVAERFDRAFVEHVRSLWQTQGGKCRITGMELTWNKDFLYKISTATVVCLRKHECGEAWIPGNVALVCSGIRRFVYDVGLSAAVRLAREMASFVYFKRRKYDLVGHALYDAWDDECHRARRQRRWTGLGVQEETATVVGIMKARNRHGNGCLVQMPCGGEPEFCHHCVRTLCEQCGRCAISGISLIFGTVRDRIHRISIGRVNELISQRIGNIRMTSLHVEQSKSGITDEAFEDLILAMAVIVSNEQGGKKRQPSVMNVVS